MIRRWCRKCGKPFTTAIPYERLCGQCRPDPTEEYPHPPPVLGA